MNIVYQPEGSALCGQACIAMLLGVSLSEACEILPGTRGTRVCRIREALSPYGVIVGPRRGGNLPVVPGKVYIGRVRWDPRRRHGHLFLVDQDGTILDPYFGPKPEMRWEGYPQAKVTSLYEVAFKR